MNDLTALAAMMGGRRNGRRQLQRQQLEAAALAGQHVHFLARDGQWCVTRQPVGFLWARVPKGVKGGHDG